jgi:hypothetical protein
MEPLCNQKLPGCQTVSRKTMKNQGSKWRTIQKSIEILPRSCPGLKRLNHSNSHQPGPQNHRPPESCALEMVGLRPENMDLARIGTETKKNFRLDPKLVM